MQSVRAATDRRNTGLCAVYAHRREASVYRLYDWRCTECNVPEEHLTECPVGETPRKRSRLMCRWCGGITPHERLMSCPAPYMGERVLNPMVRGGSFDTMGQASPPPLPDLPAGVESTTSNYRQLFETKEWKEARAEQKHVNALNAEKRERAAAIRRGANINMRRDRCAGDPKVTA